MTASGATRSKRGEGSQREKRPGVWEIRVTVGTYPKTGRSRQQSFTHHGDAAGAQCRRAELVEMYGLRRVPPPPSSASMTVRELLEGFLTASHRWSVTTWRTYRGQAAMLCRDAIRRVRLDRMTPNTMERHIERWIRAGVTPASLCGRFRTLHAAISWAVENRLLLDDPLAGVSGPARPAPRRHLRPGEVRKLITTADALVEKAAARLAEHPDRRGRVLALFRAEQNALLVRLAADSATRRGELTAFRIDDLVGRTLEVSLASQDGVVAPVKNHLNDSMTLGKDTVAYWHSHVANWSHIPHRGPWLFSATPERLTPLLPNGLGQRFRKLARAADLPKATLHRLRHTVGTYLVSQNKIVEASKRLRHRDVATTLREYYHALPLHDQDIAERLATLYGLNAPDPAGLAETDASAIPWSQAG